MCTRFPARTRARAGTRVDPYNAQRRNCVRTKQQMHTWANLRCMLVLFKNRIAPHNVHMHTHQMSILVPETAQANTVLAPQQPERAKETAADGKAQQQHEVVL